jgi:hypothetical protein
MAHSNVYSLGGNDVFFDGQNKSYVVQSAMQNNSETRFFRITTGGVRLDCEIVASILATEGVCHHICFVKMIMDFQFIILDQL